MPTGSTQTPGVAHTGGRPPSRRADAWCLCGLLLLSAIPFGRVAWFDFVSLDDAQYVTESELVRSGLDPLSLWGALTEFHADNWHPLVWWSLMLDRQVFGMTPGAFHLVNLAWHLANVAILFVAMKELTGDRWRSAVVAAVFGVHPLHVESVAWISERKDVLSGAFWMLGLWAYARWARTGRSGWWWLVTGCLICGLMSKQILVTLPCVMLLLDGWPLGRFRNLRLGKSLTQRTYRLVMEKLPWFGLCAAAALVAMQAQSTAREAAGDWPLSLRLSNAVVSAVRYLGKSFWPTGLSVQYQYDPPAFLVVAAATGLLLAITLFSVLMVRRKPAVLVGWLWYLGTLTPVIGLVQVGEQSMADRYMYLPLIGLTMVLAWLTPTPRTSAAKWGLAGLVAVLLGALTVRAADQAEVWRTTDALFQQALRVDPTNDSAHYVLGSLDLQAGRLPEGIAHLQTAVEWDRKRWEARRLYAGNRNPAELVELNRRWAAIDFQLAQASLSIGQTDSALKILREAVTLDPESLEIRLALGKVLAETGAFGEARAQFDEILKRQPASSAAAAERARIDFQTLPE